MRRSLGADSHTSIRWGRRGSLEDILGEEPGPADPSAAVGLPAQHASVGSDGAADAEDAVHAVHLQVSNPSLEPLLLPGPLPPRRRDGGRPELFSTSGWPERLRREYLELSLGDVPLVLRAVARRCAAAGQEQVDRRLLTRSMTEVNFADRSDAGAQTPFDAVSRSVLDAYGAFMMALPTLVRARGTSPILRVFFALGMLWRLERQDLALDAVAFRCLLVAVGRIGGAFNKLVSGALFNRMLSLGMGANSVVVGLYAAALAEDDEEDPSDLLRRPPAAAGAHLGLAALGVRWCEENCSQDSAGYMQSLKDKMRDVASAAGAPAAAAAAATAASGPLSRAPSVVLCAAQLCEDEDGAGAGASVGAAAGVGTGGGEEEEEEEEEEEGGEDGEEKVDVEEGEGVVVEEEEEEEEEEEGGGGGGGGGGGEAPAAASEASTEPVEGGAPSPEPAPSNADADADALGVIAMWSGRPCGSCGYVPTDEEVQFQLFGADATEEDGDECFSCPNCDESYRPRLGLELKRGGGGGSWWGELSRDTMEEGRRYSVAYMSVKRLRREMERVVLEDGERGLGAAWLLREERDLYWNVLWYYHRLHLPLPIDLAPAAAPRARPEAIQAAWLRGCASERARVVAGLPPGERCGMLRAPSGRVQLGLGALFGACGEAQLLELRQARKMLLDGSGEGARVALCLLCKLKSDAERARGGGLVEELDVFQLALVLLGHYCRDDTVSAYGRFERGAFVPSAFERLMREAVADMPRSVLDEFGFTEDQLAGMMPTHAHVGAFRTVFGALQ